MLPGQRFRRLRTRRGLSLAQVARATGVSVGFLSALERGQMRSSVATLRRIARFYRTNILSLFEAAEENPGLVRPAQRKVLETTAGVRMELLALGPHGDGTAFISYQAERRQRRIVRARRRRIPACAAGEFEIWLGDKEALHTENRGQLVFRQFDATPVEKSRADGDATALGEYAADVLGLRSLDF